VVCLPRNTHQRSEAAPTVLRTLGVPYLTFYCGM